LKIQSRKTQANRLSDRSKCCGTQEQAETHDDDLPSEIDFSGGIRGKFHRPNARLNPRVASPPIGFHPAAQSISSSLRPAVDGITISFEQHLMLLSLKVDFQFRD
jgi:hypothetical protein